MYAMGFIHISNMCSSTFELPFVITDVKPELINKQIEFLPKILNNHSIDMDYFFFLERWSIW